ncbi:hypothetical protein [Paenibacillus chitinolyticus]|uniref:hypothetical protein n=1 Tax=Paenibacillus chitinolyticus TaxID=79263 RepID=UPI00366FC5E4
MSVQTDNKAYGKQLSGIFGKSFLRLLKNIGKDAVINGIGWLHPYYNETGKLKFKRIPPQEAIPFGEMLIIPSLTHLFAFTRWIIT